MPTWVTSSRPSQRLGWDTNSELLRHRAAKAERGARQRSRRRCRKTDKSHQLNLYRMDDDEADALVWRPLWFADRATTCHLANERDDRCPPAALTGCTRQRRSSLGHAHANVLVVIRTPGTAFRAAPVADGGAVMPHAQPPANPSGARSWTHRTPAITSSGGARGAADIVRGGAGDDDICSGGARQ